MEIHKNKKEEMKIKKIEIWICEACLEGQGEECHTPGCALFLHAVDFPIGKGLYTVIAEYEELRQPEDSADICENCGFPKNTHPRMTCWGEEPFIF